MHRLPLLLIAILLSPSLLSVTTAGAVTSEQITKVPLLDDLRRSDPPPLFSSSGIGSGKWSTPTAYGEFAASRGGAYNSGGRLGYGSPGGWAAAYWNAKKFADKGGGVAVRAKLTATLGNGETISLWLNQPSPTTAITGYQLYIVGSKISYQGIAQLIKWSNGSPTVLSSGGAFTASGTSYALVERNGEITAWADIGSGFVNPAPYRFTDGSPIKEGYAGLQVYGTGPSLDNFSAGELQPAKPTPSSTSPLSPGSSTTPSIVGSADSGSTVKLYTNSSCSGGAAATGSAASFASPGLSVSVEKNSTTTFYAIATNSEGVSSACSTSSVTYVQDSTPPPQPTLSWTDPVSPGASTSPKIAGNAESGSTVKLYASPTCTGSPIAMGSAAAFAASGLTVSIAKNSTTTYHATATDSAGNISSCSSSSIAYVNDDQHILFEGQHVANFNSLTISPAGSITEVADPLGTGQPVLKFTLEDSLTNNPRAQLLSPSFIESGDEFWLRAKFLIPATFPSVTGWMTLIEPYGPPFNGTSPWRMEAKDNEFVYQRNGTYGYDIPWFSPLIKGSWNEVLVHEKFGYEGFLEIWFNGTKVKFFDPESWNPSKHPETEKLEMATMDDSNDGGPNSVRIGQYREKGMFGTATLYHHFIKVGTTRESVGG